jgi:hypothetical protein
MNLSGDCRSEFTCRAHKLGFSRNRYAVREYRFFVQISTNVQRRLPDEDAVHKPHVTTRLAVTAVGVTTDTPATDSRVAVKDSSLFV